MKADIYPTNNTENALSQRSDTALTQEIVGAILSRLRDGKPITKRGRKTLILDYAPGQDPVSVSTYTSWLRRGTIPLNSKDNHSLYELVNKAREYGRARLHEELLRKAEAVLEDHLDINTKERIVHKRINREGKVELKNGTRVVPKLVDTKQRAAEFVAKRLDRDTYGDSVRTDNRHLVFSLSELRRHKEQKEQMDSEAR